MPKLYYGIGAPPKYSRRATPQQAIAHHQIRHWGEVALNHETLAAYHREMRPSSYSHIPPAKRPRVVTGPTLGELGGIRTGSSRERAEEQINELLGPEAKKGLTLGEAGGVRSGSSRVRAEAQLNKLLGPEAKRGKTLGELGGVRSGSSRARAEEQLNELEGPVAKKGLTLREAGGIRTGSLRQRAKEQLDELFGPEVKKDFNFKTVTENNPEVIALIEEGVPVVETDNATIIFADPEAETLINTIEEGQFENAHEEEEELEPINIEEEDEIDIAAEEFIDDNPEYVEGAVERITTEEGLHPTRPKKLSEFLADIAKDWVASNPEVLRSEYHSDDLDDFIDANVKDYISKNPAEFYS